MEQLFRIHNNKLECLLCPHFCKITAGETGICGVRKNLDGRIELITKQVISGYSLDPVEKKPLYHFFPGHNILSIGSYGCNMRCDFCQNYHISQNIPEDTESNISSGKILKNALSASKNIGIAFTYNEPVIWFEFVNEISKMIKGNGLKTVLVTNGYINSGPLGELLEMTDAFNVDLKAFNNDFYKRLTGAALDPVKDTLRQIVRAERHLEITTLLIPGQNDEISEMENQVKWIASELGEEIPFHLSRYFPIYKRKDPITPHKTLMAHFETASKYLKYVYLGNSMSETGQDTSCPGCGVTITSRSGYHIRHINTNNGNCLSCGKKIYNFFTFSS
jgi:pyruvate formate lyase activating enzyme